MDVTSLYTNIPHEEGADWVAEYYAETLKFWPKYTPDLAPIDKETLKKLILFILQNTTF